MKLFTVGPVACYPIVLKAMGEQMYSHRSAEYKKLHYGTLRAPPGVYRDSEPYLPLQCDWDGIDGSRCQELCQG